MSLYRRLAYWLPALAAMSIIAYLSHQPTWPDALTGQPDWLLHGTAYAVVALALHFGLTAGRLEFVSWPVLLAAVAFSSLYGVTDEWHQSFIPGRDAAVLDWVADTAGAVIAGIGMLATQWLQPRRRS